MLRSPGIFARLVLGLALLTLSAKALGQEPPPVPVQVEILFVAGSHEGERFAYLTPEQTVTLEQPRKLAESILYKVFARNVATFDPPWPIVVVVQKFRLRQVPAAVNVSMGVIVVDARDRHELYRGEGEAHVLLDDPPALSQFAARMQRGLYEAADEAGKLFMNRQGAKPLPTPSQSHRDHLGIQVLSPTWGMLTWRRELSDDWSAEIGGNPGLPFAGVSGGILWTAGRWNEFDLPLGLGVAYNWPKSLTMDCSDGHCLSLAYAYVRAGVGWTFGDRDEHRVGAELGGYSGKGSTDTASYLYVAGMAGVSYFFSF